MCLMNVFFHSRFACAHRCFFVVLMAFVLCVVVLRFRVCVCVVWLALLLVLSVCVFICSTGGVLLIVAEFAAANIREFAMTILQFYGFAR